VSFLLFPSPASAAETLDADLGAWFWSSHSKVITCTSTEDITTSAPGVCATASSGDGVQSSSSGGTEPISTGHLGVALKDGSSDMRSYIRFDASSIPPNATIESFVVTLTVSDPDPQGGHVERHLEFAGTNGHPPATVNQSAAGILACAVTEGWFTAEGDPPSTTMVKRARPETGDTTTEIEETRNEPFSDCSLNATGEPLPDLKTWRFDITKIAQAWSSGVLRNEGIALLPVDRGVRPTWIVEFHGPVLEIVDPAGEPVDAVTDKEAATAAVSFGPPPPDDPGPPPPPPPPLPPLPPPPPVFPEPQPDPGAPPPPAEPPQVLRPVAVGGDAQTPGWLFGLIPIGLLGLGLTSSAIGAETAAAVGGRNRVARILQERRVRGLVYGIEQPDEEGSSTP